MKIEILVTKHDNGDLEVRSVAPPYVVIGELAQAIALLAVQEGQRAATAPRVLPVNGELRRVPPNVG